MIEDKPDGCSGVVDPAGTAARLPHAVLDLTSRRRKALKIECLLGLEPAGAPIHLLEVGTGAGGLAHYFGTHPHLRCEVDAVDVHDSRQVTDGYRFRQVSDTRLPFSDGQFDVVLSNHVIEHVGDERAQRTHLAELRRVLRPGGVGYLAVPGRWMLVEPHYQLAFLSWLPRSWRSPYLRVRRKGSTYDCEPLQMRGLERMLSDAGFEWRNRCLEALRMTLELEGTHSLAAKVVRWMPDPLLRLSLRMMPTFVYTLRRGDKS
ncbi:class I SAM-dependent methyltransferase [Dokdonella fugitiva]|jgi:SAM-dependent methyltransferase|uniref:Ubiquinone/menaquinone biosynthesis C-methylase UbiE n=1 Tax=Dokdonella fugitiva TaxID=328517 RepID=A0A4R2IFP9_9GAMM|nr:class I SAM-dependent methyltransferase [Dokdonella fugitiva]TCO42649.1 ubiquinone/menaquinone biosynthesis C-methylase UbiE [Dokdonella fugitiva]